MTYSPDTEAQSIRPSVPPISAALRSARERLDSGTVTAKEVDALLGPLSMWGRGEDIDRIDRILKLKGLHEQVVEMALEVRRRIQEREYMLLEIDQEEERCLRAEVPPNEPLGARWIAARRGNSVVLVDVTRASTPPESGWVAVRRGRVVAEGADREAVERQIEEKQRPNQPYVAFGIELGAPLPQPTRI